MIATRNSAPKRRLAAVLTRVAVALALSAPVAAQAQNWNRGGYEGDLGGRVTDTQYRGRDSGVWGGDRQRDGDRYGDRHGDRYGDRYGDRRWDGDGRRPGPGYEGGPRAGWGGPGPGGQRWWRGRWWARGSGPCWRWSQRRQNWKWVCD